jgi:hypothetical protein
MMTTIYFCDTMNIFQKARAYLSKSLGVPNFENNISKVNKDQHVLVNEDHTIDSGISGKNILMSQPDGYQNLMFYFKINPEVLAIVNAYVTDILSDGHIFKGKDSDIKEAEEFYNKVNFTEILTQFLFDAFIQGNGMAVINFVSDNDISNFIGKSVKYSAKSDYFLRAAKSFVYKNKYKYCNIQYLPASTVSVYSEDKYGNSIKYKQVVGLDNEIFDSSEVIHYKDIPVDGKLLGYSRLYAIKQEMQITMNSKDYIGRFFDNNGTPSMIFVAKDLVYGSDKHKDYVKQLKSFKESKNKNSNMLALSDTEVIKLNDIAKDMQFKELINKMTEVMAMSFQMPISRLGGSTNMSTGEAALANQGYYHSLFSDQSRMENLFNNKLWKKLFNVEWEINKPYKEDLLRDVNIEKIKTDVSEQRINKNLWTRDTAASYLNIKKSEMPKEEDNKDNTSQFMQGQIKQSDTVDKPIADKNNNKIPKNPNMMVTNTN